MINAKLAIAPIGWTNDDDPNLGGEIPFEQCVSEMALAGFAGCEVGSKFPKDTAVLKKALELRNLKICNAWFGSSLIKEGFETNKKRFIAHRDFLHSMGAKVIGGAEGGFVAKAMTSPNQYTSEQWKTILNGYNEFGKLANEKKMSFLVHHHLGTGFETMEQIDRLMAEADPKNVNLLYDCGHAYAGGIDPLVLLKKHIKRIKHVHLKDVRANVLAKIRKEGLTFFQGVVAGLFTVPGDKAGCIEFDPLFKVLEENSYQGWIVVEAEQDPKKANPLEYAIMARRFIKEKTSL